MKKIFGIATIAMAACAFTGCSKKSDWEYIEDKGKMIVGYTLFEPIAYNEGSTLTGFDIELAKETASILGINVEFQLIDWDNKEIELNSKTIDVIWNGLTVTDERKANMEFSMSYLANNQVAVIRKDDVSKYTKDTLFTVENTKYCAETGSAGADIFEEKNITYTKSKDMVTCLTELNAKTSDVAIMDSVMARYYMNANPNLMVVENCILAEEEYGIAARKGDVEFVGKINDALRTLKDNGKLNELATKYGLQNDIIVK